MASNPVTGMFGGLFSAYGDREADRAQSRVEMANAEYYKEQARITKQSGKQELSIFNREIKNFEGSQVSSLAKAGVDVSSGSALSLQAQTKTDAIGERLGIINEYRFREKAAKMQARQSRQTADTLRDGKLGFVKSLGTILGSS